METQHNLTPTPATAWQGKVQVEGVAVPLPSGNVALVRAIAPEAFLTSGMIPDPLLPIIQKAIHTKKGLNPKELERQMGNTSPELIASSLEMFDRVLVYAVVEPNIEMPPPCRQCEKYANTDQHRKKDHPDHHQYREGERDSAKLYADQVDMQDKMFIFQWSVGGTSNISAFRQQLEGNVALTPNR
jgi:hypothetical protein